MRTPELAPDERPPSPAWGNRAPREPRWPATLALAAAVALYVALPAKLIYAPFGISQEIARWVVPGLELALIIPLQLTRPHHGSDETKWRRMSSLALIGLVNLANLGSLILLVDKLLHGSIRQNGSIGLELIYSAILIWLTNVIIFGFWYWMFDRGGPVARAHAAAGYSPAFLFPQMGAPPEIAETDWRPMFFDYLYTSFTNATAFSPTDVMPLARWAKLTMMLQSAVALLLAILVIARAVNVLK